MILATTLLAASVVLQVRVDDDYTPKPGDRAVLGLHITDGGGPGRTDYVMRAECFSTLENARLSAACDDEEEGRFLDTIPDAYMPRVGTPVEIIDVQPLSFSRGGKVIKGRAFKVRVLGGEFKGRVFFVRRSNIVRLIGDQGKPAAAVAKRRAAPGRAPVAGDLVLTDLVANRNGVTKFVAISGRFRNTSGAALKGTMVSIIVEDGSGKMLRSTSWFCQPVEIEPGDVGTFEVILEDDPAAAGVKLDFKTIEKAIPWVDRSGKDAHQ